MEKISWQDRARSVHAYHISKCKENEKHRLEDTARELNRSVGRVSEDITLVEWMKTFPKIEAFEFASEALQFIKSQRRKQKLGLL